MPDEKSPKELAVLNKDLISPSFEVLPNALIVRGKPSEEEYEYAFNKIKKIEGATQWWVGDLALAYEKQKGYGKLQTLSDEVGYKYNTVKTYKYVADKYEMYNRLYNLQWDHYRIAASEEDKLKWLKKAEENNWRPGQLQNAIRDENRKKSPPLPPGIYNVIYADPAWEYGNVIQQWGAAEPHYKRMDSIEDLCNMQIPSADNSILFLWVTNPFLQDALKVVGAWGFEYKTNMVWVKTNLKKPGSGFYIRGRHELLYLCTKGSFLPTQTGKEPIGSVIDSEDVIWSEVREHSKKPDGVYALIEKMYPKPEENPDSIKYLELFARNTRPSWTSWGDEV